MTTVLGGRRIGKQQEIIAAQWGKGEGGRERRGRNAYRRRGNEEVGQTAWEGGREEVSFHARIYIDEASNDN